MRSSGRLVAVLVLMCLLAPPRANAQEGGFLPPLNAEPVIPIPTGQAGMPGFHTSAPEFFLVLGNRPKPLPSVAPRPPKPGEHLGDYLIAEKLPPRYQLPPESPKSHALAPILPIFYKRGSPDADSPVPHKREPDGRIDPEERSRPRSEQR